MSHFAAQYKDKVSSSLCSPWFQHQRLFPQLLAEIEGRTWSPEDTPPPSATSTNSSLRKPRSTNSRGSSPAPSRAQQLSSNSSNRATSPLSAGGAGGVSNPYNQKARNEDYFASMGSQNEGRSADLPPSQGGKYGGFGSDASYNPSNATSSRALPRLDDLRDDPVSALGRGWGFLGAALSQASRTINEYAPISLSSLPADLSLETSFNPHSNAPSTPLSNPNSPRTSTKPNPPSRKPLATPAKSFRKDCSKTASTTSRRRSNERRVGVREEGTDRSERTKRRRPNSRRKGTISLAVIWEIITRGRGRGRGGIRMEERMGGLRWRRSRRRGGWRGGCRPR